MQAMRIIRFSELKTTPWKNGGGITREIAARRSGEDLAWRLSMADVDSDGPFSRFDGLTRILTVIEGAGMDLIAGDKLWEARYGLPVLFDGALSIESKLTDGPIRDLNLMFNPKICTGAVTLIEGPRNHTIRANANLMSAVLGLRGASQIDKAIELKFGDTILLEAGVAELSLDHNAAILIITVSGLSH